MADLSIFKKMSKCEKNTFCIVSSHLEVLLPKCEFDRIHHTKRTEPVQTTTKSRQPVQVVAYDPSIERCDLGINKI